MKFKTTKKAVNNGYSVRVCVPYCDLQHLLALESPVAYTSRREGWAADIYDVGGNVAIVTGYAPFGNVKADYTICRKYEQEAQKIRRDCNLSYEQMKEQLRELLQRFVKEVTQ